MSYRRAENEDGNYAKGFRAVRAGLCDRVPDGVRSMKKTLYRQASERARDYEKRVNQVIKRGRIRYGNGYASIGGYRKIRAIDGSLIKVDLELIAKGWE